jgi:hypothetical protein
LQEEKGWLMGVEGNDGSIPDEVAPVIRYADDVTVLSNLASTVEPLGYWSDPRRGRRYTTSLVMCLGPALVLQRGPH